MLATLPYPIVYPKFVSSGIQITVKANIISSVMAVFGHGFHNNVIAYMLQFGESPIHRSFAAWLIFVKVTFSCIISNLMMDFYISMLKVFSKTGHGLTDIIFA